jgi:choline dehydrogenase-like flavoprotein
VLRIETGADDRVTGVLYAGPAGAYERVSARAVIVSCGAVETPRLLLTSKDDRHSPQGLANESGQVGRNFMETLLWASSGIHPSPLGSFRGIMADLICWDFNAPDAIKGIVGGCRFMPGHTGADFMGPVNYALRVVKGFGKRHRERMRELFGRVLTLAAIGESLPNDRSFIDLSPDQEDEQGMALARIHSYLDDMELERLSFMASRTREVLEASGIERTIEEFGYYDFFNASHVFGTCRMGDEPDTSVVDRHLRSHRWKNLFVVDASVFPSSGGGESPSLTIEALALRASEYISEMFRLGEI